MQQPASEQSISRQALGWLLVAQFLVILPHLNHLPYWEVGLWVLCAFWRVQVFRMRASLPSVAVKGVLLVAALAGIYLSNDQLYNLEGTTDLLVAPFVLKVVELRKLRDALTIVYLGFFVVTTRFLFDSQVFTVLECVPAIVALLSALLALQMGAGHHFRASLTKSCWLLLQALPLTLILFVAFPRLDPFWHMPQPKDKAQSGLSDHMSPGDIAELGNSSALVFRASFDGSMPSREQLYWRAFTLDFFDGRAWEQGAMPAPRNRPRWVRRGDPMDYTVIMEASNRPWLYVLDVPDSIGKVGGMPDDFRLQRNRPVDSTYEYHLRSWLQALMEPDDHSWPVYRALRLPRLGNPRARAWAAQLAQHYQDPDQLGAAVVRRFREQPFVYTLTPPPLGNDSVDAFLFNTRQGFCEHYASATAFVLRAAGVPARVVVGYQGGEISRSGNYLQVHQYDAHAWVEYWRKGKGWVRADPTFQVDPDRIRLGAAQALDQQAGFLSYDGFSLMRYRHLAWVNRLRGAGDDLNYGWQRFVLGYQADEQRNLFTRLFGSGHTNITQYLLGILVAVLVVVGLVLAWLLGRRGQALDRDARLFAQFEQILARRGLVRVPGEGPRAFAVRAGRELPGQEADIMAFAKGFEALRYGGKPVSRASLKRLLWRLCLRLAG